MGSHAQLYRSLGQQLTALWALAQVGSAPCGGFRSKNPVEILFNDFFSLNQGMKRVCTAFLERKPPQGADSTWASAHKVGRFRRWWVVGGDIFEDMGCYHSAFFGVFFLRLEFLSVARFVLSCFVQFLKILLRRVGVVATRGRGRGQKLLHAHKHHYPHNRIENSINLPDCKPPEDTLPECTPPEHKPPEHKPPDFKPPVHKLTDYKPPEHKLPDYNPPEHKLPDYNPPVHKLPDCTPPEHKLPDYKPPEHKPPDEKSPEHEPPEEKRREDKPVEDKSNLNPPALNGQ
jgi:hypothetical protein